MFSKKSIGLFLILLLIFTRFYRLDWGDGYFFQPDENNMAISVAQMSSDNLHPHFFAYGQFPLYLAFFSLQAIGVDNTFINSTLILRFWSAFFSSLSILFFYLIANKILKPKNNLIFLLLIIFNPGLIQLAHFGTTESLLIFIFAANLYLGFRIIKQPHRLLNYLIAGLITGIGFATKISALIFAGPILLAALFSYLKNRQFSKVFLLVSIYLLLTSLFYILFSPYNFISQSEFISAANYETKVATGRDLVFYTNQFLSTPPYIFQLTKIFPYVSGLPVYIAAFVGFLTILLTIRISFFKTPKAKYFFVLIISVLVYFLYFGQLYTKWTRFMSPLFFIFPLAATYTISRIKNPVFKTLFVLFSILPGIVFFRIYLTPDIRTVATNWMNQNITPGSIILSEAGNVVNLPLGNFNFSVSNFDFYNLDADTNLQAKLPDLIAGSDYILLPSRRIFKNQHGSAFPISDRYYRYLFDGSLGFAKIKQFDPNFDFILDSESAEETWSVFDHPTIRIYRKVKYLNPDEIKNLLNEKF